MMFALQYIVTNFAIGVSYASFRCLRPLPHTLPNDVIPKPRRGYASIPLYIVHCLHIAARRYRNTRTRLIALPPQPNICQIHLFSSIGDRDYSNTMRGSADELNSLGCSVLAWTDEQGTHDDLTKAGRNADRNTIACEAPFPRTVCAPSILRSYNNANQAAVTMPERPRMILRPPHETSTNRQRLLHMLKNDRVAVL
jgi:hypothetical protein